MDKKVVHIDQGMVLLAEPYMDDPNFKRSAILLCEHHAKGSMGFIMNKPLHMNVTQLVAAFPEFESQVYYGGPVATDTIHYIHNIPILEDSYKLQSGLYWGGDFEKLKVLVSNDMILPENIRFFVGYSGWDEGQLIGELNQNHWVTASMHPNYLFKSAPEILWRQIMANKGENFAVMSQIPDPICLN